MTQRDDRSDEPLFETSPASFLQNAIKAYVASSPSNHPQAFHGGPIFDEPLVGFADGDDPIFQEYKAIIGDFHLTPREALEKHPTPKAQKEQQRRSKVSVISWVLPVTYETRLSLRKESIVPSLRWNHTRWLGQDFINELANHMVSLLQRLGHQAVAPESADFCQTLNLPDGLTSNWSQRHIAYAAGLGTFSLSDGFITPRGIALRCGSVVCDVPLPPSPRPYQDHLANCFFYTDRSCRRCIERCPAGAISEQGHDKKRCADFVLNEQKSILKELGREEGYIGYYLGCGLCQTKVPCEAMIPPRVQGNTQQQQ